MAAKARKTHEYKVVNPSGHRNFEEAANVWAEMGWRVVAVISDTRPGYTSTMVLERPVDGSHPHD